MIRNKLKMKSFRGHRMNTNPRKGPFHYNQPSRMFYRVVRGMMPHKTPKGKKQMGLLHAYDGMPRRYMPSARCASSPRTRRCAWTPT